MAIRPAGSRVTMAAPNRSGTGGTNVEEGAPLDIVGAPVTVRALEKQFGSVAAVRGVTLEVEGGEFLALLGPSGSGKTTILMTIAGFEFPDAGAIVIDGRDMTAIPANRRNIGMVFQRYALFPHMSVFENIAFPLKMRRLPKAEIARRVADVLALVQLDGYGDRMPAQLSGGQQQRVALARAIVFSPPVLLLDEPLAALDRKLKQAMQIEFKRLQRRLGVTVIYVTHDQEEALTMSDRVAVLNHGRLEQIGRPEQLYESPANAFVADFIGETNFLAGEVVAMAANSCAIRLQSGLVMSALPAAAIAPGTAVRLAIRPECVCLGPPGTGLDGVLAERVFAGAMTTHVVRLANGAEIKCRLPGNGVAHGSWEVGQEVGVSWQKHDARAYAAAAS